MKNKLLFSSLIVAAMLLSSINSAFSVSDDLTFTMPTYKSIEVDSSSVTSGTAQIASATSLSLSSPITVTYNFASNIFHQDNSGIPLGIVSSVQVDNNQSTNINIGSGYIVFTKSDGTTTSSAVSNITGNLPTAANNPNAIAFPIACTESHTGEYSVTGSADYAPIYNSLLSDNVVYRIYNSSEQISCTISGDSISNTYDVNDTIGNYSATLTLTELDIDYSYDP